MSPSEDADWSFTIKIPSIKINGKATENTFEYWREAKKEGTVDVVETKAQIEQIDPSKES